MSTLDELERELGPALRATLGEMISGPDDDPVTTGEPSEPRQPLLTPGTGRTAHRQHRRAWVAAAAAAIAVATVGALAWTQRPGSIVQTDTPDPTVPTTSPVTTEDVAEDSNPDRIGASDIDAPARPTSFPIWPDDPTVDIRTDVLTVGWGGAPITVAVVERSGDRADPIVIGASPAKFETIIAETGGEPVGTETLGDGTPATEFVLPGGATALTWETPAGSTIFVAGADPAGFMGQLGDGALVEADQATGAGDPSLRLGVLPDDYEVTVPPTYSPKTKVAAFTHVRDPFDRIAGIASIEASPHVGVLSMLFFTPLEPAELAGGTPAWWTYLPDRELEMLIWQQDDDTWIRTLGTDRETILDETLGLSWVDEDTWTRRYGTEDNESAPAATTITVEEFTARRAVSLALLPGYSATQTTTWPGNGFEQVRNITVLADGRGWADDETGSWWSIDPSTDTFTSFLAADGDRAASAQVIAVPDGAAVPPADLASFLSMAGDPAAPLAIPPEDEITTVEVVEVVHDGGPAWQITVSIEPTDVTVRYEAVHVIDGATGLTVASSVRKWDVDGELDDHGGYVLTGLTVTSTLPDAYPGVIPDGVAVDEMPLPGGLRSVTRDEAAAAFDPPGLLVPANPHGEVEYYLYDAELDAPGVAEPKRRQVRIVVRNGFDLSEVVVTGFDADPALTTVDDDGIACYDLDADGRCDHLTDGPADRIGVGALAGRRIGYGADGQLRIFDIGRYVEIRSTDLLRAGLIANDLEPA